MAGKRRKSKSGKLQTKVKNDDESQSKTVDDAPNKTHSPEELKTETVSDVTTKTAMEGDLNECLGKAEVAQNITETAIKRPKLVPTFGKKKKISAASESTEKVSPAGSCEPKDDDTQQSNLEKPEAEVDIPMETDADVDVSRSRKQDQLQLLAVDEVNGAELITSDETKCTKVAAVDDTHCPDIATVDGSNCAKVGVDETSDTKEASVVESSDTKVAETNSTEVSEFSTNINCTESELKLDADHVMQQPRQVPSLHDIENSSKSQAIKGNGLDQHTSNKESNESEKMNTKSNKSIDNVPSDDVICSDDNQMVVDSDSVHLKQVQNHNGNVQEKMTTNEGNVNTPNHHDQPTRKEHVENTVGEVDRKCEIPQDIAQTVTGNSDNNTEGNVLQSSISEMEDFIDWTDSQLVQLDEDISMVHVDSEDEKKHEKEAEHVDKNTPVKAPTDKASGLLQTLIREVSDLNDALLRARREVAQIKL